MSPRSAVFRRHIFERASHVIADAAPTALTCKGTHPLFCQRALEFACVFPNHGPAGDGINTSLTITAAPFSAGINFKST